MALLLRSGRLPYPQWARKLILDSTAYKGMSRGAWLGGGVSSKGLSSRGVSSKGLSSKGVSSRGLSSRGVSSRGSGGYYKNLSCLTFKLLKLAALLFGTGI